MKAFACLAALALVTAGCSFHSNTVERPATTAYVVPADGPPTTVLVPVN